MIPLSPGAPPPKTGVGGPTLTTPSSTVSRPPGSGTNDGRGALAAGHSAGRVGMVVENLIDSDGENLTGMMAANISNDPPASFANVENAERSGQRLTFKDTLLSREVQEFQLGVSEYGKSVETKLNFISEDFQRSAQAQAEAAAIMSLSMYEISAQQCELLKRSEYRQLVKRSAEVEKMERSNRPVVLLTELRRSDLYRASRNKSETLHRIAGSILAVTGRGMSNGSPWFCKLVPGTVTERAAIKVFLDKGDRQWDEFLERLSTGPEQLTVSFNGSPLTLIASRPDAPRRVELELRAEELSPAEIFDALLDKVELDLFGTRMSRAKETGVLRVTLPILAPPPALLADPSLVVDGRRLLVRFLDGPATCGHCYAAGHHSAACKDKPPPPSQQKCTVCDRTGHLAEACWRAHLDCYSCGKAGHVKNWCPDEKCSSCKEQGHRSPVCKKSAPTSAAPPASHAPDQAEPQASTGHPPQGRQPRRRKSKKPAAPAVGAAPSPTAAQDVTDRPVSAAQPAPPPEAPLDVDGEQEELLSVMIPIPSQLNVDDVIHAYDFSRVDTGPCPSVHNEPGEGSFIALTSALSVAETAEQRRVNIDIANLVVELLVEGHGVDEVKRFIADSLAELRNAAEASPIAPRSSVKRQRPNGTTPPPPSMARSAETASDSDSTGDEEGANPSRQ